MKAYNIDLSIIVASYNSAHCIEKLLCSLLSQNFQNFECWIIDGGSSDRTLEIIKEYQHQFKNISISLQYISEKDEGIYHAWNKGLALAKGNWIAFIGSDDFYQENALHTYYEKSIEFSDADFITSKALLYANGRLIRKFGTSFSWGHFSKEMNILHAGGWHNRKYFDEYGIFDQSFKITGDYELLLRKGKEIKVVVIDDYLVGMEDGGISSANKIKALKEAELSKVKNATESAISAKLRTYWILLKIKLGALKRRLTS